ncbi:hypothetical protein HNP55_000480 [Paucibacter oligotrophus]|uniref:Uncharacterized protein n=1 Tax=Roseateles oligotrophus TaxID=1769250 RepID=A0A840L5Y5_9BURK|nr:hypothetical protein [Roseateles oligotrophus]
MPERREAKEIKKPYSCLYGFCLFARGFPSLDLQVGTR